ncbi:hypothetical protein BST27_25325 [Mycobacterium intermedium]|uniref:DUF3060 domain-containing protein n=1 Tax=Mycobacterium intermedium TaxID=28445 RepID=A0A1E3S8T0_MYCIE|nr:DUF3060 domain-containing protein [Mycobacterium intermedium]MCV6964996.1 DUF3060 domain-containing protein [Mycobacterium intermedium]ODQ98481.1 hypothetical protein BHQ20_21955 [Mycobacterium intermedium]OPE48869.1 hypothetical protein BV508_16445 [Mycobacterium intermedium]ORA96497.1 hypothetical protein BST27_25325 [Mycobacterium intermedium]
MNPEDDPEARIRQLEQSLADVARASEFGSTEDGGQAYRYPPPPAGPVPPPVAPSAPSYGSYGSYSGYGSAFPGATPRSSSGMRMFWILAAVFVLIALGVAGAIAFFVRDQLQRNDFSVPTISETFGTVAPPAEPTSAPSPPDAKTAPPTAGPTTSAPPQGAPLTISGIDLNRTVACNDNVVTVSGISNTVVITGHCASVTVSGTKNTVTVDSADKLDTSGFDNKIIYHTGSPTISKSGSGNEITQG